MKQRLLDTIGAWHYGQWLRFKHFGYLIPRLPCDLRQARILDARGGEGTAALSLARRYLQSQC